MYYVGQAFMNELARDEVHVDRVGLVAIGFI